MSIHQARGSTRSCPYPTDRRRSAARIAGYRAKNPLESIDSRLDEAASMKPIGNRKRNRGPDGPSCLHRTWTRQRSLEIYDQTALVNGVGNLTKVFQYRHPNSEVPRSERKSIRRKGYFFHDRCREPRVFG